MGRNTLYTIDGHLLKALIEARVGSIKQVLRHASEQGRFISQSTLYAAIQQHRASARTIHACLAALNCDPAEFVTDDSFLARHTTDRGPTKRRLSQPTPGHVYQDRKNIITDVTIRDALFGAEKPPALSLVVQSSRLIYLVDDQSTGHIYVANTDCNHFLIISVLLAIRSPLHEYIVSYVRTPTPHRMTHQLTQGMSILWPCSFLYGPEIIEDDTMVNWIELGRHSPQEACRQFLAPQGSLLSHLMAPTLTFHKTSASITPLTVVSRRMNELAYSHYTFLVEIAIPDEPEDWQATADLFVSAPSKAVLLEPTSNPKEIFRGPNGNTNAIDWYAWHARNQDGCPAPEIDDTMVAWKGFDLVPQDKSITDTDDTPLG